MKLSALTKLGHEILGWLRKEPLELPPAAADLVQKWYNEPMSIALGDTEFLSLIPHLHALPHPLATFEVAIGHPKSSRSDCFINTKVNHYKTVQEIWDILQDNER